MIRSAESEVRTLLGALAGADAIRREAALARLIILGERAVGRVAAAYDGSEAEQQLAILRVLEASGDERALPVARRALSAGGDRALAAVAVLRELATRGQGSTHAQALELLLTLSADRAAERRIRAAAAEALDHVPGNIRRAVSPGLPAAPSPDQAVWEDALEGRLPDQPDALADAIAGCAGAAPLPVLRRLVDLVAERERAVPAGRRQGWQTLRGVLHATLAARGSRVALYDLREALERTEEPLPAPFLAALQTVGDASCLEPIAAAFGRAADSSWRASLARTFHAIVRRERLTKRHAAVRKAMNRAPDL